MCIWDSCVYRNGVLCFLIHKSYVRSIKKYCFVRKYAAIIIIIIITRCTHWRSWLRHYAISWKAEGSFPDEVTVIFHFPSLSRGTMALDEAQPLTEMSTGCISWGVKAAGA